MEAFDAFLTEAHANGIKVVMDFVVNHTCDESAWFKDAVTNENSQYKDFYVWANDFDKIDDKWS
jgi:glycosidase